MKTTSSSSPTRSGPTTQSRPAVQGTELLHQLVEAHPTKDGNPEAAFYVQMKDGVVNFAGVFDGAKAWEEFSGAVARVAQRQASSTVSGALDMVGQLASSSRAGVMRRMPWPFSAVPAIAAKPEDKEDPSNRAATGA